MKSNQISIFERKLQKLLYVGRTLKYNQFFETTIIGKATVLQFFTFKIHRYTRNLRFVKTNTKQLIRSLFKDSQRRMSYHSERSIHICQGSEHNARQSCNILIMHAPFSKM